MTPATDTAVPRRRLYTILIVVVAASLAGRILSAMRVYEPSLSRPDPARTAGTILLPLAGLDAMSAAVLLAAGHESWDALDPEEYRGVWPAKRPQPMPSWASNERSRWCTVRALVDQGTYAIGYRDLDPETGTYKDRGIVFEDGWQTIDKVLRPDVHDNTQVYYSSKPPLLATVAAGEYWLLKHVLGWSITREPGWVMRTILFTANWLPFVIYLVLLARLLERFGTTDWGRFYVLAAGCFGTFITTFSSALNNHTAAAFCAFYALYPALLIWYDGRVCPGLFALAGFFAACTACYELPAASFAAALALLLLWRAPLRTLAFFLPAAIVPLAAFLLTNYLAVERVTPAYSEVGGLWYAYPGSYWEVKAGETKHGIDWANLRESHATYGFHVLLGHHGFFSLTPIFLLALGGMAYTLYALARRDSRAGPPQPPRLATVVVLTLVLSVIVLGFYLMIAPARNYGGVTSNLRWLIWLTPLWLLTLLPVADWLAPRRWGRVLAYLCLALSVVSASYPVWTPWRHPWVYDFMTSQEWLRY